MEEYYENAWGFRPSEFRVPLTGGYAYEDAFPVTGDPLLEDLGAEVVARVEVRDRVRCRLGVRAPALGTESWITCIHAVVYKVPPGEPVPRPEDLAEMVESVEGRPALLPPEEHFAALRSFAAGLAEVEISNADVATATVGTMLGDQLAAAAHELLYPAARSPNTPATTLEQLAGGGAARVRRAVARNPSSPSAVLERLAGDGSEWVRRAVAEHPSCPPALLERLAGDEDWEVRAAVARNPSCPPALLERLTGDEDWEVRAAARGPRAPPAPLLALFGR